MDDDTKFVYFKYTHSADATTAFKLYANTDWGVSESMYVKKGSMPTMNSYGQVTDYDFQAERGHDIVVQPCTGDVESADYYIIFTYWACFGTCDEGDITLTASEMAMTVPQFYELDTPTSLVGVDGWTYMTFSTPEGFNPTLQLMEFCIPFDGGGGKSWGVSLNPSTVCPSETDVIFAYSFGDVVTDTTQCLVIPLDDSTDVVTIGIKMWVTETIADTTLKVIDRLCDADNCRWCASSDSCLGVAENACAYDAEEVTCEARPCADDVLSCSFCTDDYDLYVCQYYDMCEKVDGACVGIAVEEEEEEEEEVGNHDTLPDCVSPCGIPETRAGCTEVDTWEQCFTEKCNATNDPTFAKDQVFAIGVTGCVCDGGNVDECFSKTYEAEDFLSAGGAPVMANTKTVSVLAGAAVLAIIVL